MSAYVGESTLHRVLVLAPTGKDAELTRSLLTDAGIDVLTCEGFDGLCRELEHGAGAILLPEEELGATARQRLVELLSLQPAWSDLPILLVTRHGADSPTAMRTLEALRNVTVLERPIRVAALLSVVRAALRARNRQYQIRSQLIELERAERALLEADRRKDDFLAMLAHELRNPLAPLRNALEILRLSSGTDPRTIAVREMMERQVDTMIRLVDDLLDVSRITRGKVELRRERVDLHEVVRGAIEATEALLDAAGCRLEVFPSHEPLSVEGDRVRLAQVFTNLLNNAAKYTGAGGWVRITARRSGNEAVVSVRDSGIGIEPDMLERVFEIFAQADNAGRQAQGGLGIGLTLVRSLVQMHGGSAEARSEGRGRGSEFVVRLPLSPGEPCGGHEPRRRTEPIAALRVLVVDDNCDAADSMGLLLGALGADVRIAHDGARALRLVEEHRPDVVLLDIGMPGMDGYEVARRIRCQPSNRDVVLVALTGWGQEQDRRRSSRAGFDRHLVKPAMIEDLQAVMRCASEGRG